MEKKRFINWLAAVSLLASSAQAKEFTLVDTPDCVWCDYSHISSVVYSDADHDWLADGVYAYANDTDVARIDEIHLPWTDASIHQVAPGVALDIAASTYFGDFRDPKVSIDVRKSAQPIVVGQPTQEYNPRVSIGGPYFEATAAATRIVGAFSQEYIDEVVNHSPYPNTLNPATFADHAIVVPTSTASVISASIDFSVNGHQLAPGLDDSALHITPYVFVSLYHAQGADDWELIGETTSRFEDISDKVFSFASPIYINNTYMIKTELGIESTPGAVSDSALEVRYKNEYSLFLSHLKLSVTYATAQDPPQEDDGHEGPIVTPPTVVAASKEWTQAAPPVPEPSTYALALAGLFMVAAIHRRAKMP